MRVQIKEVLLKELPDEEVKPFDASSIPADAKKVEKAATRKKAAADKK